MILNKNGIYISGNGWYFLGRKGRGRREEQIESLIHPRLEGDEKEQAQEDGRGCSETEGNQESSVGKLRAGEVPGGLSLAAWSEVQP